MDKMYYTDATAGTGNITTTTDWQIDCSATRDSPIDEHGVLQVPPEVYLRGCVATVSEGLESARRIGFPVMIKARKKLHLCILIDFVSKK